MKELQTKLERLQCTVNRNQQQWETTLALERQAHKAAMMEMQAAVVLQCEAKMERRLQSQEEAFAIQLDTLRRSLTAEME